ncbi:MAG: 16S rRNA (cytidine(1402)-2'-O)-methyltransferase [Woeseiaceae bacterium]|nr:16S rRNA (cytidine(1402)-2'-O)-methyltransferase [Woeseiaceae bacterium]
MTDGTLYVVATPIGNRDDLAPRARDILRCVDIVASEDTRRTGRLLSHFGIAAGQVALHEHNESQVSERLVAQLQRGESVALVSDAGTPLISDPGYRLLTLAHAAGIRVSPLPGPSALTAALSVCGLPTDRFCFEGFLPAKARAGRKRLTALEGETRTLVFYEAVHRVREMLEDLDNAFGADREGFIGRELSKLHEQCVRASLGELAAMLADGRIPLKGEFVVIVAGRDGDPATHLDTDRLLGLLLPLMPQRQAVDIVTAASGQRRNEVYRRMLELRHDDPTPGPDNS